MTKPRVRYPVGGRDSFEVTVSYLRHDGLTLVTRVGWGKTLAEAVTHSDEQLPSGEWKRLVVSTRNSVYNDLKNAGQKRTLTGVLARYEGETVTVERRVSAK